MKNEIKLDVVAAIVWAAALALGLVFFLQDSGWKPAVIEAKQYNAPRDEVEERYEHPFGRREHKYHYPESFVFYLNDGDARYSYQVTQEQFNTYEVGQIFKVK